MDEWEFESAEEVLPENKHPHQQQESETQSDKNLAGSHDEGSASGEKLPQAETTPKVRVRLKADGDQLDSESDSESEDSEDDDDDGLVWRQGTSTHFKQDDIPDSGVVILEDTEQARADTEALLAKVQGKRRGKSNDEEKVERQKQRKRLGKRKQRRGLEHRAELLIHLARVLRMSSLCDDCKLWKAASSVVPDIFKTMDKRARLGVFINWFHDEFAVCHPSDLTESTDASFPSAGSSSSSSSGSSIPEQANRASKLEKALEARKGPPTLLTQLFVALCRSVGIPCRLCAVLQPRELKLPSKSRAKRKHSTDGSKNSKNSLVKGLPPVMFWAEVLVGTHPAAKDIEMRKESSQIKPIDLLSASDDDDDEEEEEEKGTKPIRCTKFSAEEESTEWVFAMPPAAGLGARPLLGPHCPYVVAVGTGNFVVDITAKYAARWTKTSKMRHFEGDGWWHVFTLEPLRNGARHWVQADPAVAKALPSEKRQKLLESMGARQLAREEDEMAAHRMAEKMPTSIEGFKRHPTMILASQVSKFNVAMPGTKPIGTFKGTKVLLRNDIKPVKTERQWKRLARVVDEDEKDCPAKIVEMPVRAKRKAFSKSKTFQESVQELEAAKPKAPVRNVDACETSKAKSPNNSDDSEINESQHPETAKTSLFGEWQTYKYVPPEIGPDGKVPTSEYGNVEMWTPSHCPRGGTHVQVPLAASAAATLGIPYAAAMIGFEVKDGRQVPKVEGVVVATRFAATVEEAAGNMWQERIRKAEAKRLAKIVGNWERFIKGLLVGLHLKKKYGAEKSSAITPETTSDGGDAHATKRRRVDDSLCAHEFHSTRKKAKGGDIFICSRCGLRKVGETL